MKNFKDVYDCDSITINTTNYCNLNCTYCFEHSKNHQMMKEQTAIDIIDAAYKDIPKDKGIFTINIFGGEPLINWKAIKALIDHCNTKKYNVKFGITTNLTILTDEMIEYIDDNEIMMLVSIDGIKQIHDKNRCNSFNVVLENLKKLIKRNLGLFVEARMTILPEDVKYALDGVKMLIDTGIFNICPMPVTDVEWSDEATEELEKYYINLMQFYTDYLNSDSKLNLSIKNTDEVLTNVLSPEVDDPIMCPIYTTQWCAFDTNGDIYPCHQGPTSEEPFKKDMLIGNIYTGVDETKLNDDKVYASYKKDKCKDCIGKSICKGGCPTENIRETGIFDTPSDNYCNTKIALVKAVKQFQDKIINADNIRNRSLNLLKENLKIKEYVDLLYNDTDLDDCLTLKTRILHIYEMISNLGYDKLLPTFEEYINAKLAVIVAYNLDQSGMTMDQVNEKLKEENHG